MYDEHFGTCLMNLMDTESKEENFTVTIFIDGESQQYFKFQLCAFRESESDCILFVSSL